VVIALALVTRDNGPGELLAVTLNRTLAGSSVVAGSDRTIRRTSSRVAIT